MKRAASWLVMLAAVLAAALVGAGPARAEWPLWDGKESVADYAKRAGIKDVETTLDLGDGVAMRKYKASTPFSAVQFGLTQKQYEQFLGRPVSGEQSRGYLSQELLKKILAADPGYLEYFNCKTRPAARIGSAEE
jgi:hypothetical protein